MPASKHACQRRWGGDTEMRFDRGMPFIEDRLIVADRGRRWIRSKPVRAA
jgi:hypothetical protein